MFYLLLLYVFCLGRASKAKWGSKLLGCLFFFFWNISSKLEASSSYNPSAAIGLARMDQTLTMHWVDPKNKFELLKFKTQMNLTEI